LALFLPDEKASVRVNRAVIPLIVVMLSVGPGSVFLCDDLCNASTAAANCHQPEASSRSLVARHHGCATADSSAAAIREEGQRRTTGSDGALTIAAARWHGRFGETIATARRQTFLVLPDGRRSRPVALRI